MTTTTPGVEKKLRVENMNISLVSVRLQLLMKLRNTIYNSPLADMWVLRKPKTKEEFEEKMERLTAELLEQFRKSEQLEKKIKENLKESLTGLGYEL